MPGGEKVKSDLHFVEDMQRALYENHIDRHSYAIAIGGGAVLDAVGLAAATTHRGVRHIRIPTTVLSQNDSGVGVKNGVNHYGQKNFVGTFAPPFAVLNDLDFAMSLGEFVASILLYLPANMPISMQIYMQWRGSGIGTAFAYSVFLMVLVAASFVLSRRFTSRLI